MATVRRRHHLQSGLAVVACLTALVAALPQAWSQVTPRIDCANAVTTPELNWCADRALNAADKKLNEAFQRAMAQIDAANTMTQAQRQQWSESLREAQRRWIAFRDQDCGEVIGYEWFGGSGMTGAMLGCKAGKTEARTKELVERYSER